MRRHIHIHFYDAWEESKHPRGKDGKFGRVGNGNLANSSSEKSSSSSKYLKELEELVSPWSNDGPKSYAKKLHNKGYEVSFDDPDFRSNIEKIKAKKLKEYEEPRTERMNSPEMVAAREKEESARSARIAKFSKSPAWSGLNKKDKEEIEIRAGLDHDPYSVMERAVLKSIGAESKKAGFLERHVSIGRDGRVSSRYLTAPGGREVRVSDHYIPSTPQREASGGGRWVDEFIIGDAWQDHSIPEMLEIVRRKSLGLYED